MRLNIRRRKVHNLNHIDVVKILQECLTGCMLEKRRDLEVLLREIFG